MEAFGQFQNGAAVHFLDDGKLFAAGNEGRFFDAGQADAGWQSGFPRSG